MSSTRAKMRERERERERERGGGKNRESGKTRVIVRAGSIESLGIVDRDHAVVYSEIDIKKFIPSRGSDFLESRVTSARVLHHAPLVVTSTTRPSSPNRMAKDALNVSSDNRRNFQNNNASSFPFPRSLRKTDLARCRFPHS